MVTKMLFTVSAGASVSGMASVPVPVAPLPQPRPASTPVATKRRMNRDVFNGRLPWARHGPRPAARCRWQARSTAARPGRRPRLGSRRFREGRCGQMSGERLLGRRWPVSVPDRPVVPSGSGSCPDRDIGSGSESASAPGWRRSACAARALLSRISMKRRAALLLILPVAWVAKAEDLSARTRLALHQALELHATEPVAPPSLPQSLTHQLGVPGASAAAAAQATQAASRAQTEAANQAAQEVANGRGRGHDDANDASRDAAGQKRGAEAKETGGKGHGPDKPGKSSH